MASNNAIVFFIVYWHIDGLAHYYSNPSAFTMKLLQSCAKPSVWVHTLAQTNIWIQIGNWYLFNFIAFGWWFSVWCNVIVNCALLLYFWYGVWWLAVWQMNSDNEIRYIELSYLLLGICAWSYSHIYPRNTFLIRLLIARQHNYINHICNSNVKRMRRWPSVLQGASFTSRD